MTMDRKLSGSTGLVRHALRDDDEEAVSRRGFFEVLPLKRTSVLGAADSASECLRGRSINERFALLQRLTEPAQAMN